MITGIIIALPDEVSSLTQLKVKKRECVVINDKTLLIYSGAGPDNAAKASQLLIDQGAKRLISWGCAAALKPGLHPGDLIIPEILHPEDDGYFSQLPLSSAWFNYVTDQLSSLNPHTGSLAGSNKIVAKASEKKSIHRQTRAIALDMESCAIANTAKQHDLDMLVIRCIADPASMDLPEAVCYSLNQQGDIVIVKLLWFLLTHPKELSGLIKLGINFNAAKNKLKLVAKHLDIIGGFEQQRPKQ